MLVFAVRTDTDLGLSAAGLVRTEFLGSPTRLFALSLGFSGTALGSSAGGATLWLGEGLHFSVRVNGTAGTSCGVAMGFSARSMGKDVQLGVHPFCIIPGV